MSNEIIITKVSTNTKLWGAGTHTWTYTLNTFKSFDIDLLSPISLYSIPENEAESSIVLKLMGNEMRITINWLVKDGDTNRASGDIAHDTKTAMDQIGFLTNEFQPTGLQDSYTITINGTTFTKTLLVESIKCHTGEEVAPNWTCTINAVIGNVITAYNSDAPRPPIGLTPSRVTATSWNLAWSVPGTSPVPTKFIVERKGETEDWYVIASNATSPYNVTASLNEKYRYRVRSRLSTDTPAGYPTDAVLVTFV